VELVAAPQPRYGEVAEDGADHLGRQGVEGAAGRAAGLLGFAQEGGAGFGHGLHREAVRDGG